MESAATVDAQVDRDPVKPRSQNAFIREVQAMPMQPDKRVLRDLFSISPVTEDPVCDAEKLFLARPDYAVECVIRRWGDFEDQGGRLHAPANQYESAGQNVERGGNENAFIQHSKADNK